MIGMICKDIYDASLHVLGESRCDVGRGEDYEERAPYLIAAFCCEAGALDRHYRKASQTEEQKPFSPVSLSLSDEFPLSDRFFSPAVNYLASMLVVDELPELSDKLFARCCDTLSSLYTELPSTVSKIKNKYL